jgi:hypothetical protein
MKLLSVIVPCRNEREFIEAFCASVAKQKLPAQWWLQVVIADGQSDDGTRSRLDDIAARDARFLVIDNPGCIVSAGLNAALAHCRGEVIARLDCTPVRERLSWRALHALAHSGADNVGDRGARRRATQAAHPTRHRCGVPVAWLAGGARSRQLDYSGWVDTVYLGCWPRQTFARFGGFDESLVRNQDDEHNLRIVSGGGRVWQSAAIRSSYRPRASIGALFRQYLQYGYWKPLVIRKHGRPAAARHLLPPLLVLALAAAAGAAVAGLALWPLLVLTGVYGAAVLLASALIAAPGQWRLLPVLPAVIVSYHSGYGLGSLLGWFDVLTGTTSSRKRFAGITR